MEQSAMKDKLDDLLLSLEQYLNGSLPHMKSMADKFYKQVDSQLWEELAQFSEALEWIFQVYESIGNAQTQQFSYANWASIKEQIMKLTEQLAGLEKAITLQNLTMVGDLIHYEVIPILEELHSTTKNIIDHEVIRHDLN